MKAAISEGSTTAISSKTETCSISCFLRGSSNSSSVHLNGSSNGSVQARTSTCSSNTGSGQASSSSTGSTQTTSSRSSSNADSSKAGSHCNSSRTTKAISSSTSWVVTRTGPCQPAWQSPGWARHQAPPPRSGTSAAHSCARLVLSTWWIAARAATGRPGRRA